MRLLVPLSIVLAACGGAGAAAATVNGIEITLDDINGLVAADGAVDQTFFIDQLNGKIVSTVVLTEAADQFGITATEEDKQARYDEFKTQLEASAETYEAALTANGITDLRVLQAAEEQVVADALREELLGETPPVTDEAAAAEFEANGDQYRNGCIMHILLETEDEALTTKLRLDDGEDFAAVAAEVSIEPSAAESGGDLGCSPVGGYVVEFADGAKAAEVGAVTDPVESEFGWHLILVNSIDDDATVEAAIRVQLQAASEQAYFAAWIEDALSSAEITVDAQYGVWSLDPTPGIVPPTTTPSPSTTPPSTTVP